MSQFEFFMIIASILIAIVFTEIIGGWGTLLKTGKYDSSGYLYYGWSSSILIVSVSYWNGFWPYANANFDQIQKIWALLIPTIFLILSAMSIKPTPSDAESTGLADHFNSVRKRVCLTLAIAVPLAVLADWIVLEVISFQFVPVMVGLTAVFLWCAYTTNRVAHTLAFISTYTFFVVLPIILGIEYFSGNGGQ